jgi:CubicO group peptidase (beta-lactamase class C family)
LEEQERYGGRLSIMYKTERGGREPMPLQDAAGMAICRPGASARGPVRELGRFYQMLLNGGELEAFMHTLDFGMGFILNSNQYGAETVPYGYGRHASEKAFGHSGAQSSCAFADPEHGLVVSWVANGMPGERLHHKRQRAVNSAIYEWLDLVRTTR